MSQNIRIIEISKNQMHIVVINNAKTESVVISFIVGLLMD